MPRLIARLDAMLDAMLDREASTRPAALMRIGLACLILTRFADQMMLQPDMDGIHAGLLLAFWVGTLAMLAGIRARLATGCSAIVLALCALRFGQMQHRSVWNHHHVYLLITATACLALTACGRSYSFDRYAAVMRAREAQQAPPKERGPVWAGYLIAVQLSAVYFWGAIDKCSPGWLRGDKFESQLLYFVFDSDPPALPAYHLLILALSIGTVLLEFSLAAGLWLRAARPFLIPLGIAFHVMIYVTLPVTIFSALSCLLYLAYLDPDEVHAFIDRMSGAPIDQVSRGAP